MNSNMLDLFNQFNLEIVGGNGCYLLDNTGRNYLDFISGVGVNQLGYSTNLLNKAISKTNNVIHLPLHFSNIFSTSLSSLLVEHSKIEDGKVFFCTSGSEANEAFIKFLTKASLNSSNTSKTIVAFTNSFHGRTLGSINLTRQNSVRAQYNVFNGFEVVELPFNESTTFKEFCTNNNPIAVIVEPVQGSGGINIASEDFLSAINEHCCRNNCFLAIDEVQSGMGRTGTLFASSKYNLNPDFIMFGKGTGGGLPLAGTIVGQRISPFIKKGDHGTTWCNPFLSAALGLETINFIFEHNVLENVFERSQQLFNGLNQLKKDFPDTIKEVRVSGLMIGIELLLSNKESLELQNLLLKNNLLVDITKGNVIRMLPPLVIKSTDAIFALNALTDALQLYSNK